MIVKHIEVREKVNEMPTEYSADMVRPSSYGGEELSDPLTIRLPVGLKDQLDLFVANAKDIGFQFVNRTFVIRDALEAYLAEGEA